MTPRPGLAAVCAVLLLAACGEREAPARRSPPVPVEWFERLELLGSGAPSFVEAHGETRAASLLDVGARGEFCVPAANPGAEARVVSLGFRTSGGKGTELHITPPVGEPLVTPVGSSWRDVSLSADEAGCFALALSGKPGTQAAISLPTLRRRGARRPWVILYVIDSLRFDALTSEAGDGGAEPAPALSELARHAVVYERAFTVSPWARSAAASLLSGELPSVHRVQGRQDRMSDATGRLSAALAARGFATEAISSNPDVTPAWNFMPGFDRFVEVRIDERGGVLDFHALTQRVVHRFEESADRALFLYVHDAEPSAPRLPPQAYREAFGAGSVGPGSSGDRDPANESRIYAASVRSLSDRFAEMVTVLKRIDRYDDALIVVVASHGEVLGERGRSDGDVDLSVGRLHVPLVIKLPEGRGTTGVVETAVSTSRLASTVLHLLDSGRSEAPVRLPLPGETPRAEPILSEVELDGVRVSSLIEWPWKLVRADARGDRLFDLAADPDEELDVSKAHESERSKLSELLEAHERRANGGLSLTCVAGAEPATARFGIAVGGSTPPAIETSGLDHTDRVSAVPGRVEVSLQLRPAAPAGSRDTRDRPSQVARMQPDRDRVRVKAIERDSIVVLPDPELPLPRIETPSGAAIEPDVAVSLHELAVPAALLPPDHPTQPVCIVYYVGALPARGAASADETSGELGYLR